MQWVAYSISFDKHIRSYSLHLYQGIKCFSHSRKSPHAPFQQTLLPVEANTDLLFITVG